MVLNQRIIMNDMHWVSADRQGAGKGSKAGLVEVVTVVDLPQLGEGLGHGDTITCATERYNTPYVPLTQRDTHHMAAS